MDEHDNQTRWRITMALIGLLLISFGAYLVYEKVGLAILSGVTEERAGLTYRAEEPVLFWISVSMFAVIGLGIVVLGLAMLWNILRPGNGSGDR